MSVRGKTFSISSHIFLWSRTGCRRLWSPFQIVPQLFWTSSWLALAKVSFDGFLAGIGTSCLASVHPMWQLAPYLEIYLWGTHDIPAAVKEEDLGGWRGKLACHWLMCRACLPVCFSCPSWWRWVWPLTGLLSQPFIIVYILGHCCKTAAN